MKKPATQKLTHVPGILEVLRRVMPKIDATLVVEPKWGYVGQITFKNGVRRYFRSWVSDINTLAASEIARDKGYTRHFLQGMDYPIPPGDTFFAPAFAEALGVTDKGLKDAWAFAQDVGLPVFVKPNSLSQGKGVRRASNKREFESAAKAAMKLDKVIVVEKAVTGRDYRLVVLDDQVISAYERIPLTITGDGKSTVSQLLDQKEAQFVKEGRDTILKRDDIRLKVNLRRSKLNFDSVLPAGIAAPLLENANLSTGGTSVDVTNQIHPTYKLFATQVAWDMGLRLSGVDIMTKGDLTKPMVKGDCNIIEVNSAPGLDHYVSMGEEQKEIVDSLFIKVLTAMEQPRGPILTRPSGIAL